MIRKQKNIPEVNTKAMITNYAKSTQEPLIVDPIKAAYKIGFNDAKYYHEMQNDDEFYTADQRLEVLTPGYLSGTKYTGKQRDSYLKGVREYFTQNGKNIQ